jgi:hypothetical protein
MYRLLIYNRSIPVRKYSAADASIPGGDVSDWE